MAPASRGSVGSALASAAVARLREAGAQFHTWREHGEEEMIRLVTSYATTEDEVDAFLALL